MKITWTEALLYAAAAAAAYMMVRRGASSSSAPHLIPIGATWDETQGAYRVKV